MTGLATMLRRSMNAVLSLLLMLSVSAAGYGYAAGADHCWMMALHGHFMQAAAEHCADKQPMAMGHDHHAGMEHHGASQAGSAIPGSRISAEMVSCQCCLGPAASSLQPSFRAYVAASFVPVNIQAAGPDSTIPHSLALHSNGQRAPPEHLLYIG